MNLLDWYLPLDVCTSLDEVCAQWHALLDEHCLTAGDDDPRYRDALLSFLVNSALPAPLKLGAMLCCVSSVDLDVRLPLGLLDEQIDGASTEWPAAVGEAAATGCCLSVPTADPRLAAFVAGRLAGLRDTLRHDGTTPAAWRRVFWNKYLELACRWADSDGVRLALQNSADVQYADAAALVAVAEGAHALRTPYYMAQRSHADYRTILGLLRDAGIDLRAASDIVLTAAAAVDNVDMLEELVAVGADLHSGGGAALVAAASNFAVSAVDWLLGHGVDVHANNDDALIGAIASLDESIVETLLTAGADVHTGHELPLCTAVHARPHDLYNGETEFIDERAAMIALLLRYGADATCPAFAAELHAAANRRVLMAALATHSEIDDTIHTVLRRVSAMPEFDSDASDATDNMVAEVIATMLQLPIFLVCRRDDQARVRWFDAAYVSIAKSWRLGSNLSCNQILALMTAVSAAVTAALEAVEQTIPSLDSLNVKRSSVAVRWSAAQANRRTTWDVRREVLLGWLQNVSPDEIDALARAWETHGDEPGTHAIASEPMAADTQATASVWILTHRHPALANLRDLLAGLTPAAFGFSAATR